MDVQIDELGNHIITMYQLIGIINGEQVPGLGNILRKPYKLQLVQ